MYLTSWCSCCCILAASGHPDKLKACKTTVVSGHNDQSKVHKCVYHPINKSMAVFYGLYSFWPWNHEAWVSGFTATLWTLYGVILWSIRVQTIENCHWFVFYNNMEKVWVTLLYFPWESVRITPGVIFIVCTLIDNSYEPISAQKIHLVLSPGSLQCSKWQRAAKTLRPAAKYLIICGAFHHMTSLDFLSSVLHVFWD